MTDTASDGRGCAGGARVAALAAALAAAGMLAATWLWPDPATPPPAGAAAAASAAAASTQPTASSNPAAAAAPLAGDEQSRERAGVQPGVYGRLLDSAGEPLDGFNIRLEPLESGLLRIAKGGVARTDADGGFAFRQPGHGSFAVGLSSQSQTIREEFVLPRGGRHEVELRLPDDLVVTSGRLTVEGLPMKSLGVCCAALGKRQIQRADDDGAINMILPVGVHHLQVVTLFEAAVDGWAPLLEHVLLVRATPARQSWSCHVPRSGVAVGVYDKAGGGVLDFTVRIDGCTSIDAKAISFERAIRAGSTERIVWLPPGSFDVGVDSDGFLPVAAQHIEVVPIDCLEPLSFEVVAAEVVLLRLHEARQKPLLVPPDQLPPLQTAVGEIRCEMEVKGKWGTMRPRQLGYRRVPHGEARLELQDHFVDGEWRYLPFEPVAGVTMNVQSGRVNDIVVEVVRRALVDLRACERGGREQLDARIDVFRGAQRVRSNHTAFSNRWLGHLPPGEYRVVVDRNGDSRETAIVVSRTDLRQRLRP